MVNLADNLCDESTNFTFADPFLSCVALTNTYLYMSEYNPYFYEEFLDVTNIQTS